MTLDVIKISQKKQEQVLLQHPMELMSKMSQRNNNPLVIKRVVDGLLPEVNHHVEEGVVWLEDVEVTMVVDKRPAKSIMKCLTTQLNEILIVNLNPVMIGMNHLPIEARKPEAKR